MSRNQQHRRKRQKQLYLIALLLCLAVLVFSVWLLFIPNTLNRAGESSALQNSASDSSTAAGTNAPDTPANTDAQGFLAVLEGSTAQLPAADGSWNSSDTSVAEVDSSGTVTGVQQGRCQITDGKTAYQIAVRHLEQRQEGT